MGVSLDKLHTTASFRLDAENNPFASLSLDKLHITAAVQLDAGNNPFGKLSLDKLHVTAAWRLDAANNPFASLSLDKLHVTAAVRGPAVGYGAAPASGAARGLSEVLLAVRPAADAALGGWRNEAAGALLFPSISKAATDDATYIVSALDTPNDTARVKLGVPDYELGDEVEVEYRIGKYPPLATQALDITVRLLQGTTEIAAWSHPDVAGAPASVIRLLTGPQVAAISDFSDLYLEFVSNPQ